MGAGFPRAAAGRFLQVLGLVLLPLGLWFGIVAGAGMTIELGLLAAGVVAFLLGRAIAGK
jgi:hypothetical protein